MSDQEDSISTPKSCLSNKNEVPNTLSADQPRSSLQEGYHGDDEFSMGSDNGLDSSDSSIAAVEGKAHVDAGAELAQPNAGTIVAEGFGDSEDVEIEGALDDAQAGFGEAGPESSSSEQLHGEYEVVSSNLGKRRVIAWGSPMKRPRHHY